MSDSAPGLDRPRGGKGREAFRTISEVADELDLPQHVLRFWESKFSQIKPLKRGGNRRYYRPDDVTLLKAIKKLLHADGYTIRGVQKLFKAQGVKTTVVQALELDVPAADGSPAPAPQPQIPDPQTPDSQMPGPQTSEPSTVQALASSASEPIPSRMSRDQKAVIAEALVSLKRLRASLD